MALAGAWFSRCRINLTGQDRATALPGLAFPPAPVLDGEEGGLEVILDQDSLSHQNLNTSWASRLAAISQ